MRFIDSYQVEVSDGGKWIADQSFRPYYRWKPVAYWILGLFRLGRRQKIDGDAEAVALVAKSEAVLRARMLLYQQRMDVRITRYEREGARLVKFIIWQDGEWVE